MIRTPPCLSVASAGLCLLAAAACGTSSPHRAATSTAKDVTLRGWVVFKLQLEDPFTDYDDTAARATCLEFLDAGHFPQVVIHAPDGDTIAAGTLDPTTMQYSELANDVGPSEVNCGARWHSPTLPRLATYTVNVSTDQRVVNLADAANDVDFRGN